MLSRSLLLIAASMACVFASSSSTKQPSTKKYQTTAVRNEAATVNVVIVPHTHDDVGKYTFYMVNVDSILIS